MNRALFGRRAVRWTAATQVAVLGIAGILFSGTPAAAAVVPGAVLVASSATLPAELSPLATGKRITYATTSASGVVTTATGLVLTPKTGKKNQTVVWGHGSTGLADKCTPSTNQAVLQRQLGSSAVVETFRVVWMRHYEDRRPGLQLKPGAMRLLSRLDELRLPRAIWCSSRSPGAAAW